MPITANGLVAKKFSDILSEINLNLKDKLAGDVDTSPETILGIISNIFAEAISDQEDLIQVISDNGNVDKAEGKYLEDLMSLIKISRLGASPSSGTLEVTGNEGTEVTVDSVFTDLNGNEMKPVRGFLLTKSNCNRIEVAPLGYGSAPAGTVYTVGIDNLDVSVFKLVDDTPEVFLSRFALEVSQATFVANAYISGGNVIIQPNTEGYALEVDLSDNISQISVTGLVPVELVEDGPIDVPAKTATQGSVPGLISVTNTRDFNHGRFTESDEELRARHSKSVTILGNTTLSAITAKLLQVPGVTSARVIENSSSLDDINTGLPANSYECIVTGGSDLDVSSVIFESKPISIETVGNTSVLETYLDNQYEVKFTRPSPKYLWARVEYSQLFDSGVELGVDTDEAIIGALLEYASTLSTGDSFIPRKSLGNIYGATTGIGDLYVSVGVSDDPQVEPESYSQNTRNVNDKSYLELVANRISIASL